MRQKKIAKAYAAAEISGRKHGAKSRSENDRSKTRNLQRMISARINGGVSRISARREHSLLAAALASWRGARSTSAAAYKHQRIIGSVPES